MPKVSQATAAQPRAHIAAFIEEMRAVLRSEKERLERDLRSFIENKNSQNTMDTEREFDLVNSLAESSVQQSVGETLEKEFRDVHKSLERIEKEVYGVCKYCDALIEQNRLRARPTSSACVSCKKTLTDEA